MIKFKRMLDLYCGAGGAAMGYHRAFGPDVEIVGVDHKPQPRYPFEFIQADALEFMRGGRGDGFDFYHASPPCQKWSEATPLQHKGNYPDLITPTRRALMDIDEPFVIENVECARAELVNPIKLCGSMLGLPIWRHRYFEVWPPMFPLTPPCNHNRIPVEAIIDGQVRMVQVPVLCTGGGDGRREKRKTHRPRGKVKEIRWAMDIDWMTQAELTEAIPPAYTEWLGQRIMEVEKESPSSAD